MDESEGNVIIYNNNKQQGKLLFPIATNDSSVFTVHKEKPLFPFINRETLVEFPNEIK